MRVASPSNTASNHDTPRRSFCPLSLCPLSSHLHCVLATPQSSSASSVIISHRNTLCAYPSPPLALPLSASASASTVLLLPSPRMSCSLHPLLLYLPRFINGGRSSIRSSLPPRAPLLLPRASCRWWCTVFVCPRHPAHPDVSSLH